MSTAAVRENWLGQVIDGKFPLLQWLGSSAESNVFLTELEGPGSSKAAVKLIRADATDSEVRLERLREAAGLSHPNLIRLFQVGRCQVSGTPLLYVVMEYAEEDLSQILPQRPLTATEVREMLPAVLDALSFLHGKGFVHGHLKPSNVMAVDERVKISCDCLHRMDELGITGVPPNHRRPPEAGSTAISPATDVWSLGLTLVESLTQRPPTFEATRGEPLLNTVPQPFADIARECLRSDPARRCTLADVRARLSPSRTDTAPTRITGEKVPTKFRMSALVAVALGLVVLVLALKFAFRPTQHSPATGNKEAAPVVIPAPPQTPPSQASAGTAKSAVAHRIFPVVPHSASRTIQGRIKVSIRVTVDPNGEVSGARFESSGPSNYFANLAMQAARKWTFEPAQVDGHAAPSVWLLRFQFTRSSTEVTPVEVSP